MTMHLPFSTMTEEEFIATFADIYEHSAWVAEQLWRMVCENPKGHFDDIQKIKQTMHDIVENSSDEEKLILLRAHPDLAGKAALAGEMTDASKSEQSGVGLDQCSEEELTQFLQLNDAYREKFGFPFIMAVKGASKEQILAEFLSRTPNDVATEFATAMEQVHKIAGFRLAALAES